ncbi:MAG: gluconate 2-dehydrogenase subunit 3 family protein [Pseudomonadota bacterium]
MLTDAHRSFDEPGPDERRRAALLNIAALCGLALSGEALAALPKRGVVYKPVLLDPEAFKLTAVLAELIIPATDTPGALAAGAHRVIDSVLWLCSPLPDQQRFTQGLAMIDDAARQQHGKKFVALSPARQAALLHALDTGSAPFTPGQRAFMVQLKTLTLFAYYTSEIGATRELKYLPVPGGYKGNVPFSTIGRRWAL